MGVGSQERVGTVRAGEKSERALTRLMCDISVIGHYYIIFFRGRHYDLRLRNVLSFERRQ
jgi:hypothetical protein